MATRYESSFDDPFAALPTVSPPRAGEVYGPRRQRDSEQSISPYSAMRPDGSTTQPAAAPAASAPAPPNIHEQLGGVPELFDMPEFDGEGGARGPVTFQLPSGGSIGAIPGGDLMARLRMFATNTLENYNPYSNELVQEGLDLVERDLAEKRRRGERDLGEHMAQRGIVGSSIEAEQMGQLISDLERERSRFAFDLHREQAMAELQGRQLAASIAQGALGEETRRWQTKRSLELQARGLDIQEAQVRATVELQQRANELRELGLRQDAAFRQAAYELEQERFGFERERWEDELTLRQRALDQQIMGQTGAG